MVSIMCFCFYTIIRSIVKDPEEVEELVPLILKIIFGLMLTMNYTYTAGMSATTPMKEKQGGLRHMMHLFGLRSIEYFLGMAIADWIIIVVPATVASLLILIFDEIMLPEYVWEFWVLFMFFGCAMNVASYLFTHLFNSPETAIRYLSMIYGMALFFFPIAITAVIARFMRNEDDKDEENFNFTDSFSFVFYFSPLCTFFIVT